MASRPTTLKAVKDVMWRRLEATNSKKEIEEKRKTFEHLYLDWGRRGLILGNVMEVTLDDRKKITEFERQEMISKKNEWEKAGSHKIGGSKRAYEQAKLKHARATELIMMLTIPENQPITTHLPPKISEKRLYPDITEAITPTAPDAKETPKAPTAPPPYSSNNPFTQAPVFEVKSGKLELEVNGRRTDIPDDLTVEELTEMASILGERIIKTQATMMEQERREENESRERPAPASLNSQTRPRNYSQPDIPQRTGYEPDLNSSLCQSSIPRRTGYASHELDQDSLIEGECEEIPDEQRRVLEEKLERIEEEERYKRNQRKSRHEKTDSVIITGKEMEVDQRGMSARTRSHQAHKGGWSDNSQFQCPLLLDAGGAARYEPWSHRDMNELVTVLPPLSAGGAQWIRAFEKLTAQDRLAMGDIRAIILRLDGKVKVRTIDQKAKCEGDDDREPFNNARGRYWDAIRDIYPQEQSLAALESLEMEPGEKMHAFLRRAEDVWLEGTGERHDVTKGQLLFWKSAVVRALPKAVRDELEDVVGLTYKPVAEWTNYLIHYQKKHDKAEKELCLKDSDMNRQLLRGRVADRHDMANEKKKATKTQMIVEEPLFEQMAVEVRPKPPQPQYPLPQPQHPPPQPQYPLPQPQHPLPQPQYPLPQPQHPLPQPQYPFPQLPPQPQYPRPQQPQPQYPQPQYQYPSAFPQNAPQYAYPTGGGRGGQRGACYTCGETTHFARECPQGQNKRGRGGYNKRGGGRGQITLNLQVPQPQQTQQPAGLPLLQPPNATQMPVATWTLDQWDGDQ